MIPSTRTPKVVVIGGGTGSFVVLSALKNYVRDITAIVNMVDDGGSTGILRDELGVLPPGDVRQCLVALSQSDQVMRDLFNYRFGEGTFSGHSFGNVFLTALEKTTGSFADAVKTAGEVLNIAGQVIPVTLSDVKLVLTEEGAEPVKGEYEITQSRFKTARPHLSLTPRAKLNPAADRAIRQADVVVIAPGNLYGSIGPALIVTGMGEALAQTPAKLIYVSNLVTKPGQTDGFTVGDYAAEIERFIGHPALNYVIYNEHQPSKDLLKRYAEDGEFAVESDPKQLSSAHYAAIGADLVSDAITAQNPADTLIRRTLIRHDGDKLARLIMRIYFT